MNVNPPPGGDYFFIFIFSLSTWECTMSIQGGGIGAEWGLMVHNRTRRDPWQEKGGGTGKGGY